MIFPTRAQFYSTVLKQFFVLPDSIIYYISKNPISPKCYQKMVQTCKYFFVENPIIVVQLSYFDNIFTALVDKYVKSFDLKNISYSKLWITSKFDIFFNSDLFPLRSKIYRCDIKDMELYNQTIYYEDLLLLSSTVEYLNICESVVKYNDGSIVQLERIVEAFPKTKSLDYYDSNSSSISSQTFKELLKTQQFTTFNFFRLMDVPEVFDIGSFYTYMKKNEHTNFWLAFKDPLSEAYKNRLEKIINEIIEDKKSEYKAPMITFPGLDREKLTKLCEIYYR